jgi:hypothetical protein
LKIYNLYGLGENVLIKLSFLEGNKHREEMESHTLAFDAFAGCGLKTGSNMDVKRRITTTQTHVLSTLSTFKSSLSHIPNDYNCT